MSMINDINTRERESRIRQSAALARGDHQAAGDEARFQATLHQQLLGEIDAERRAANAFLLASMAANALRQAVPGPVEQPEVVEGHVVRPELAAPQKAKQTPLVTFLAVVVILLLCVVFNQMFA